MRAGGYPGYTWMSTIPHWLKLCYNIPAAALAGKPSKALHPFAVSNSAKAAHPHKIGVLVLDHIWSPWRMDYINKPPKKDPDCVFCSAYAVQNDGQNLIVFRGDRAFIILNRYPYTSGHIMVVPYDHQPDLERLDRSTRSEMMELANLSTQVLQAEYLPQGFNIGINIGEAAGAGITDHVHLHVVPRWKGDTNFMSSLGMARVLPENLDDTYARLKQAWEKTFPPD